MRLGCIAGRVLLSVGCVYAQSGGTPQQRSTIQQYCSGCHNERLKSGGFSWAGIDLTHPSSSAESIEKAIRKVRAGMMPPPGMPRPADSALKTFASSLEHSVDQAALANPNPGRPALHRLNRTEYGNVVRDLLGFEVDVKSLLPPDDMSHGFDNMSDVLTVSPTLMEGYMRAAGRISRLAVGDPEAAALTTTYSISRVISQTRHTEGSPWGTRGGTSVVHNFPADGDYVFKLGFYYSPTGPLFGLNQGKGQQIEVAVNGERAALIDVDPNWKLATDGVKTKPIHIKAGPQRISASFLQIADGPIEDEIRMAEQSLVDVSAGTVPGITTLPHLHELSVTGPLKVAGISDTPSRRRIFVCHPAPGADEIACAKKIVSNLARQAYRHVPSANDIEALLGFYQSGRNNGDFETGIRTALQAILASPQFVFRFERQPAALEPGSVYRISDVELASRLAFFLWSSSPDEPLLAAAAAGTLHRPDTLEAQTRRMLADPRSEALTKNFAYQWLRLQNLRDVSPDLFEYPDFDRTLSLAMLQETEMLFDTIRRDDRPITELLDASYTFVNERLAMHYGIPNILGNRFRRVTLKDPNRYGLLGHGSVLMITSTATRTSPVQRGKYVMEVLLGTAPPAPPPNVPALKESAELAKPQSVRERLEEHRKNPACASCHKLMDPIGFALENFDVTGAWRANDSGSKIDSSGELFDGVKLDGPASLRRAILNHSDAFLGTFTENLLAYGLGRVVDYPDMPFVRQIEHEAARKENRFAAFVLGVVKSTPFQVRKADDVDMNSISAVAAKH